MSSFKSVHRGPLMYKKAQALPGLRAIGEAQTYTELFELCQIIFEHDAKSYERGIYYSAYCLRLRELKEQKYHWDPDKKDFKIKTEVMHGAPNSDWNEAWN